MKQKVAVFLLATALSVLPVHAQTPAYMLTVRDGMIGYADLQSGKWYETDRSVQALANASDRLLLHRGITFENRAELTQALEDFCS